MYFLKMLYYYILKCGLSALQQTISKNPTTQPNNIPQSIFLYFKITIF